MIGQDEAVSSTARAMVRAQSGLKDPQRPIAALMFAGPTGVGKTELTKVRPAAGLSPLSISTAGRLAGVSALPAVYRQCLLGARVREKACATQRGGRAVLLYQARSSHGAFWGPDWQGTAA